MAVRDSLIVSTIALMRRFGVAGTGITAVLEHSGVARRSVYLNFPAGKSELIHQATVTAGKFITRQIKALAELPDPQDALNLFVDGWKQILLDSDFDEGCPIVAAALGRDGSPQAADAAADAFTAWTKALATGLRSHGVKRSDAETLATTIIAATEGAVVMAQATRSVEPLERVRASTSYLLAQHVTAPQ